jgi:diguanylate cyclase (GGDEF)-like protein
VKLQSKIISLLVPLTVLPLLALGWVAYAQLRTTSEQKTLNQISMLLSQINAHVESKINTAVANVELFSNHNLVNKYVLTTDAEERYNLVQTPLLRQFIRYQDAYPDYYEIRILLPNGYEDVRWTRKHMENATEEEASTPYFRALSQADEDIFTAFVRNPDNQQPALLVSKRMTLSNPSVDAIDSKPKLRGYLVLTISLDFIDEQLENHPIGREGNLFVTNTNGEILLHSVDQQVGTQFPATLLTQLKPHLNKNAMITADFQERRMLFEGVQPHRDIFLVASLPDDELHEASQTLGTKVLLITLATIVITLTLLLAALEFLVLRPLSTLSNAAQEIGRGNLNVDVTVTSKDEIGALATSFDEMGKNLRRSNEQIRYLAYHDSLTGLPNRRLFQEYLSRALAHANRNNESFALLFLDIDNFKRVNDTLGHDVGDTLLKRVADILAINLRREDYIAHIELDAAKELVARLGGDEFIILLPGLKDNFEPGSVANRIMQSLAEPIIIDNHELFVSASIGITVYPTDGDTVGELIKNSDVAMYHAKEKGKNNYQYYSDSMNAAALQRLAMETKLRKALNQEDLELYYQPQVDPHTGEIVGVEALLRWNDPDIGVVSPSNFIALAEDTGLIIPIGEWALQEACRQNKAWQDANLPQISVSVNASSIQLGRQNLRIHVEQSLRQSGLAPEHLDVEITETAIMVVPDEAVTTLNEIHELGVNISLDDFGTGYSSLSYLRRFPIHKLKIDRSFIKEIEANEDDAAIISAIISLAHTLKLRVVAEGVENEHQLDLLRSMKCDITQGYLFSYPLPAAEITKLLEKRTLKIA